MPGHDTAEQVPTLPGKLQACKLAPLQLPQLVLQQGPWAQEPLKHCEALWQADPFARRFCTQAPLTQLVPAPQAFPQLPQFRESVLRVVQTPEHDV